jgi:hypothetical protein
MLANIPEILKNMGTLITKLRNIQLEENEEYWLCAGDVTALYPSMDINRTLAALTWFMETHIPKMRPITRRFILALARWILTNSYLEWNGRVFLQIIGTAMGT